MTDQIGAELFLVMKRVSEVPVGPAMKKISPRTAARKNPAAYKRNLAMVNSPVFRNSAPRVKAILLTADLVCAAERQKKFTISANNVLELPKRTLTTPVAAISKAFEEYLAIVSDPTFRAANPEGQAAILTTRKAPQRYGSTRFRRNGRGA